jgi:hypothetical protein
LDEIISNRGRTRNSGRRNNLNLELKDYRIRDRFLFYF